MTTEETTRRVGRPDQQASEELVRHILDVAAELFIEQGYPATSIEQIAAGAGSGKQTIYRRFGSKESLFNEVIARHAQRLLELAEAARASDPDPVVALKVSCREMFDFAQSPESIRLNRVVVAETARFPRLWKDVLEGCMLPFRVLLESLMAQAMASGQFRRMDPELAHDLLTSLCVEGKMRQALFGADPYSSVAKRDAYFEAAWALFVRGMRPS
jgi:AcrR family transcriptional regulator